MSRVGRGGRYPAELRERAVRMVFEHQDEYPSQWKAICSIADKLDINHESLRVWVPRAEVDAGDRPGLTTNERARIKELEREVKELRRANEILKAAGLLQVWLTSLMWGGAPLEGCLHAEEVPCGVQA